MSFLSPFFLIGFAALAIPVLVHLLNLRKTSPLTFPTIRFFKDLIDKTVKKIKIKEYILLAIRLLAVCCMVLALARPLWQSESVGVPSEGGVYVLVLDNSPSMEQIDENGPYLDQAKSAFRNLINKSGDESVFYVLATDGKSIVNPTSKVSALRKLSEMQVSLAGRNLEVLSNELTKVISANESITLALATDGQITQMDQVFSKWSPIVETLGKVNVIQVGKQWENNASVSSVAIENTIISPGRPIRVIADVTNQGETDLTNAFVSIKQQDQVLGQYSVSLEPWQSKEFLFEVLPKVSESSLVLTIELEGDRWLFDNTRWVAIDLSVSNKVLHIVDSKNRMEGNQSSFFETALNVMRKSDTGFKIQTITINELTSELISSSEVVVLDALTNVNALPGNMFAEYIQSGGGMLFIPSQFSTLGDANKFLSSAGLGEFSSQAGDFASFENLVTLNTLNQAHPIFGNVFDLDKKDGITIKWPSLFAYWVYKPSRKTALPIFSTSSGLPIFTEEKVGKGSVIISGIGTEAGWSDFPTNALYPAFWMRAFELLAGTSTQLTEVSAGESVVIQVSSNETDFRVVQGQQTLRPTTKRTIRGQQVLFSSMEFEPGIVSVQSDNSVRNIAIQPDGLESDFRRYSTEEVSETQPEFVWVNGADLSGNKSGVWLASGSSEREIWQLFLFLSLLLLATEIVFARFFKAENVS